MTNDKLYVCAPVGTSGMVCCSKCPDCTCHQPSSEKPQPEKWEEWRVKILREIGVEDHIPAILRLIQLELSRQKEQMLEVVRGMKKPDTMGHYGPNDQLHIQHNIGYNSAISDVEEKIKSI